MEPQQTPPPAPTQRKKLTRKTKAALWLLIGPTVLIAFTFLVFAILNIALGNIPPSLPEACQSATSGNVSTACENALIGLQSPAEQVLNVILFFIGLTGIVAWLPGIIIGALLLARKRAH